MKLTEILKTEIQQTVANDYKAKSKNDSYTQTRHAKYLGISPSIYSRLVNGDTDRILSDEQWIRIGKKLGVDLTGQNWKLAPTATFNTIMPQMEHCKEKSIARIFCDEIGIGKTTAATYFARKFKNVVYVNCKKFRTQHLLVRAIANEFGFEDRGKLANVRENMVNNILSLDKPFVILDDAGYLKDEGLLESIGLWDDTEQMCGWFFIGEPAFKARIEAMIIKKKLGFEAWFNRCGERMLSVNEDKAPEAEVAAMKRYQAMQILNLNMPGLKQAQIDEMLNESRCNLRTLRDDINKLKTATV